MKIPIQVIENYLSGRATESEKQLVNDWYSSFNDEVVEISHDDDDMEEKIRMNIYHRLQLAVGPKASMHIHRWKKARLLAAAVFTGLVVCTGLYLFNKGRSSKDIPVAKNVTLKIKNDIDPGSDKATLTLADGTVVPLDSSAKGASMQQGAAKLVFLDSGRLAYKDQAKNASGLLYNTIHTPRGGQYQLILADGSKVWLNASSSLRFPTTFTGKDRSVILTGEAYFEIARDKDKPFHVTTGNMQVEVLGTAFNVMAYANEAAVKTTLLEGSVRISTDDAKTLLRPGQQATLDNKTSQVRVGEPDVDDAVAWKNGVFQFNGDDVGTVMRQLERWYDLEIVYEGKVPGWQFTGSIRRDVPLSKVLKMFEVSDLHFKADGRRITVLQ